MIQSLVGGKPINILLTPDDNGGEFALMCTSAFLVFRPQSGTCRLYWNQFDFDQDKNYVTLNGDSYSGQLDLPASVTSLWLRGEAEVELTVIRRQS